MSPWLRLPALPEPTWLPIMFSVGCLQGRPEPVSELTTDRDLRFPLAAGGIWARNWLHGGGSASVVAVFRSSIYIGTATGRLFCIGGAGLGLGPLNLIVRDCSNHGTGGRWSTDAMECGDRTEARRGVLRIGRSIVLDGSKLKGWSPETHSGPVSAAGLKTGLSRMIFHARACAPPDGLGMLIPGLAGKRRNSVRLGTAGLIAAAVPAIEALEAWLSVVRADGSAAHPAFPSAARGLTGLGPGLTPSGDDFLGGLMIGLRDLGMAGIAGAIWLGLQPDLTSRTNLISIAHLEAAAAGMGHSAVHALFLALRGEATSAIDRAMTDISSIGHCSGWDTLAGLALAVRLALENKDARVGSDLRAPVLV